MEHRLGAHLPLGSREPVGGDTSKVCDVWPVRRQTYTVTFPVTEHHRPLAGTKVYCLVTGAHGCWQLTQSCCLTARLNNGRTQIILLTYLLILWTFLQTRWFWIRLGRAARDTSVCRNAAGSATCTGSDRTAVSRTSTTLVWRC